MNLILESSAHRCLHNFHFHVCNTNRHQCQAWSHPAAQAGIEDIRLRVCSHVFVGRISVLLHAHTQMQREACKKRVLTLYPHEYQHLIAMRVWRAILQVHMENNFSFSCILWVNLAYTCFCKLGTILSLRRHVDSTQLNMCINRVVKISLVLTRSTVKTTEIFNHETGQKHDAISSLAHAATLRGGRGQCLQRMNVTNICSERYLRDSFSLPSSSF